MGVNINWSDQAKTDLAQIFDYYKREASLSVARKLIRAVVDSTKYLKDNPRMGVVEPLFEKRNKEYRYLVKGNYKIIYFIEEDTIVIAMVFDARQNPIKIKAI